MTQLVILTGAGISAESGLATFRASDGLWCGHRVEEVATPEGFQRNPDLVNEFYNQRRRQLKQVQPNAAHLALAKLAAQWSGDYLLVTQNVDDLHDRAYAQLGLDPNLVLHMHGELLKARCTKTGQVLEWHDDILPDSVSPFDPAASLRPHIVWFNEMPFEMERIHQALSRCDIFVAIGTSGHVYPAAGFVQVAALNDAHTVQLNLEPSLGTSQFEETRLGKATEVVPDWVDGLLALYQ